MELIFLFSYSIGLVNNVSLLRDVVTHPNFISGDITTKFFEEHYPEGFKGMFRKQEVMLKYNFQKIVWIQIC
jgi:acetyl/propionyl-CoA carboxylase alpha subunit